MPICHHYRPQRSWAKVIFLHLFVILFTGGGSASMHAGIPPPQIRHPPFRHHPPGPGRPPPRPDRPPGTGQTPWTRQNPPIRYPPGSRLQHTVYEWLVRILLECILVLQVSVHREGLPQCMLGYTPLTRPPFDQTPPTRHPPTRHPPDQTPPGPDTPPPGSRLQHTVNERPIRILLECVLVRRFIIKRDGINTILWYISHQVESEILIVIWECITLPGHVDLNSVIQFKLTFKFDIYTFVFLISCKTNNCSTLSCLEQ